jgi:hypothetical protein
MAFIEGELFHDKRRKLIVCEKLPSILLEVVLMSFIECELFYDKRWNLIVYETFPSILLFTFIDLIKRETVLYFILD